jgi:hypothetical protein
MKKLIALIPTGGKSEKQIRNEAREAIGRKEKEYLQGKLGGQIFCDALNMGVMEDHIRAGMGKDRDKPIPMAVFLENFKKGGARSQFADLRKMLLRKKKHCVKGKVKSPLEAKAVVQYLKKPYWIDMDKGVIDAILPDGSRRPATTADIDIIYLLFRLGIVLGDSPDCVAPEVGPSAKGGSSAKGSSSAKAKTWKKTLRYEGKIFEIDFQAPYVEVINPDGSRRGATTEDADLWDLLWDGRVVEEQEVAEDS